MLGVPRRALTTAGAAVCVFALLVAAQVVGGRGVLPSGPPVASARRTPPAVTAGTSSWIGLPTSRSGAGRTVATFPGPGPGSTSGEGGQDTDGGQGSSGGESTSAGETPENGTVPGATRIPMPGGLASALAEDAPLPRTPVLAAVLRGPLKAGAFQGSVSLDVRDALTGRDVYAVDARRPRIAASTTKVLTATAALAALGPGTHLVTSVVEGTTPDEIVLVGGGDVLLSGQHGQPDSVVGRAGLADLADATATSLRAAHRTTVAVRLDDDLFSGPAVSPSWSASDVLGGYVAPIMSVEVDAGRLSAGHYASRQSDPALTAATAFARLLSRRGITVTGAVARARAAGDAPVLGQVRSAPVSDLVEYTLTESDNTVAEALARLVARAGGRPTTFTDAGVAILDRLGQLGLDTTGARLTGGSGLARDTVIPASVLARALVLVSSAEHPQLRAVLTGLPVAAASGTLADRFVGPAQGAAAGDVRAKTGTLTGVSSLAGTVVDADGRLLTFSVLADRITDVNAARAALDTVASTLARCGCR